MTAEGDAPFVFLRQPDHISVERGGFPAAHYDERELKRRLETGRLHDAGDGRYMWTWLGYIVDVSPAMWSFVAVKN